MGTMHRAKSKERILSAQHWHFVGIREPELRALAGYAAQLGARVTGSDERSGPADGELLKHGVRVSRRPSRHAVKADTDFVVISEAVSEDHLEVVSARRKGVEVAYWPEVLRLLTGRQSAVAVAGTHGKSTTAAIAAYVMRHAGADPSFLIGADVPQLGGGSHHGSGKHFVVEASEYKRSFLGISPGMGIITNVDADHLDYYNDLWDIKDAFRDFAATAAEGGVLLANADDANTRDVLAEAGVPAVTYGIEDKRADYRAERIWRAKLHSNFDLVHRGNVVGRLTTNLYGTHNVMNALAAAAACHQAGVDFADIRDALAEFEGVAHRLQVIAEPWRVPVVVDSARHPRQVQACLAAMHQRFPGRRVFVVFQPHGISCTRAGLRELAETFRDAWTTFVCAPFAAHGCYGDGDGVTGREVVREMTSIGVFGHYVPEIKDVERIIVGEVILDDVVLIMGAGEVRQVGSTIVPRIAEKGRRQIAA